MMKDNTVPKYDLLAIDIDDTLIPHMGNVSQGDMHAIACAQNAGVYVTIATGRGYKAALPIVELLGIKGLVINYGGAIVMDSRTATVVHSTALDDVVVHEIFNVAGELGVHAHLYQGDDIVYDRDSSYAESYALRHKLRRTVVPDIHSAKWSKVPKVLYMMENGRVEKLIPLLKERFLDKAAVTASSPGFIEFNCIHANKGTALEFVSNALGISMKRTAAIGDNTLDSEMLSCAGLGAAVCNASIDVKRIADVVTPPCGKDAVAWLVHNYVL